jgi:hypothetical protein
MKGISLEQGSIVILSLDGTLVYVEDVQPIFAAVVALPEQFPERASERVFTPGRVGVKKISPFSQADRTLSLAELSERNRAFISTYRALRETHGNNHIQRTPEEEAAMTVTKVTPPSRRKQRCAKCHEQPGHFNHPGDHEFIDAPAAAGVSSKQEKRRAARAASKAVAAPSSPTPVSGTARSSGDAAAAVYTLISSDLTAARAQPRGERYNDGNRSFRVFAALRDRPGSTGTLEDVVSAIVADGQTPLANPAKVARRTLTQLTKPAFGAIVTRRGNAAADDDEADD